MNGKGETIIYYRDRPTTFNFDTMTMWSTDPIHPRHIRRLSVDALCDLIFKDKKITDDAFSPYWHCTEGNDEMMRPATFIPTEKLDSIVNSVSSLNMTPLFTACRNHSNIDLIQFLIKHTTDLNRQCGSDQNTAAHAIAYSMNKSMGFKILILKTFQRSGRCNLDILNVKGETVWDLIYETEGSKVSSDKAALDALKEEIWNAIPLLNKGDAFNIYRDHFK